MTENKSVSMGIGPIGRPDATFVRKFRWTLGAHDLKEKETLSEHFMKAVKVDFSRQIIHLDSYEVFMKDSEDIEILAWLERDDMHKQVLTLITYDGCGKAIYQYNFCNLYVIEQSASFDYSVSDESIRKASIKFQSYSRIVAGNVVKPENKYIYKIKLGDSPEIEVDLKDRPSLTIEETKVSHLNASTWIPGMARWNLLNVTIKKEDEKHVLNSLIEGKHVNTDLKVYTGDGSHALETWRLGTANATRVLDTGHGYNVSLRYCQVQYIPENQEIENGNSQES